MKMNIARWAALAILAATTFAPGTHAANCLKYMTAEAAFEEAIVPKRQARDSAKAAYRRQLATAEKDYKKARKTAEEVFLKVERAAKEDYDRATRAANNAYRTANLAAG